MPGPSAIFDFHHAEVARGHATALVTVIAVTGASVRNPGAHMLVSTSGAVMGSLSGGCIEAAVAREALEAIRAGQPRLLHYGAGSPIIDIRLPCGGAVELLVTPLTSEAWPDTVRDQLQRRHSAELTLSDPVGRAITIHHAPRLRISIYGHGGSVEALARLTSAIEADAHILTPDQAVVERHPERSTLLVSPSTPIPLQSDPWTAHVFYFHDHEWEGQLLADVLQAPSLYVGAMGSRNTHAARTEELNRRDVPTADINRIKAPIGLIPSSRDPETLALSTLAEVVQAYNASEPTRLEIRG